MGFKRRALVLPTLVEVVPPVATAEVEHWTNIPLDMEAVTELQPATGFCCLCTEARPDLRWDELDGRQVVTCGDCRDVHPRGGRYSIAGAVGETPRGTGTHGVVR